MLGSPNLVLGGQTVAQPASLTFRPTKDVGKYVWDGSTPDQSLHFIAKATPSVNKTRFSYEIQQRVNTTAGQPDANIRVYMVVEYDNTLPAAISDTVVSAAIGYVAAPGQSAVMRAASARGEV